MTQREAAFLLDETDSSQISRHEFFAREPSLKTALIYEHLFGKPVSELFEGLSAEAAQEAKERAHELLAKAPDRPGRSEDSDSLQSALTPLLEATDPSESDTTSGPRVLAVDPYSRGMGYTAMEGPKRLIDWGVMCIRDRTGRRFLEHFARFLDLYRPDYVVIENPASSRRRRASRARKVLENIREFAASCQFQICLYEVGEVKRTVTQTEKPNKHEVAKELVSRLPELESHMPPSRKPWMGEDPRINLFDAAALAVTHFIQRPTDSHGAKDQGGRYQIDYRCRNAVRKYLQ